MHTCAFGFDFGFSFYLDFDFGFDFDFDNKLPRILNKGPLIAIKLPLTVNRALLRRIGSVIVHPRCPLNNFDVPRMYSVPAWVTARNVRENLQQTHQRPTANNSTAPGEQMTSQGEQTLPQSCTNEPHMTTHSAQNAAHCEQLDPIANKLPHMVNQ